MFSNQDTIFYSPKMDNLTNKFNSCQFLDEDSNERNHNLYQNSYQDSELFPPDPPIFNDNQIFHDNQSGTYPSSSNMFQPIQYATDPYQSSDNTSHNIDEITPTLYHDLYQIPSSENYQMNSSCTPSYTLDPEYDNSSSCHSGTPGYRNEQYPSFGLQSSHGASSYRRDEFQSSSGASNFNQEHSPSSSDTSTYGLPSGFSPSANITNYQPENFLSSPSGTLSFDHQEPGCSGISGAVPKQTRRRIKKDGLTEEQIKAERAKLKNDRSKKSRDKAKQNTEVLHTIFATELHKNEKLKEQLERLSDQKYDIERILKINKQFSNFKN